MMRAKRIHPLRTHTTNTLVPSKLTESNNTNQ